MLGRGQDRVRRPYEGPTISPDNDIEHNYRWMTPVDRNPDRKVYRGFGDRKGFMNRIRRRSPRV